MTESGYFVTVTLYPDPDLTWLCAYYSVISGCCTAKGRSFCER